MIDSKKLVRELIKGNLKKSKSYFSELETLSYKAKERNINIVEFREPDLNNQLTAICLEPSIEAKKLCSSIPLALKERKEVSHV